MAAGPAASPTPTDGHIRLDPPGVGRSLVGVPVVLAAGSDAHRQALEAFTGHWERQAATDEAVHVRFDAAPLALPDREPDASHLGFRQWVIDEHTIVVDDHGTTQGRSAGAQVHISAPGAVRNLERVMGTLLARSLLDCGYRVIHAAGLLAPDGVAVLALGESGAGKSTLVGAVLQHGWRALSDDLVVLRVDEADGSVWLAGFPRRLAVPEEVATGLPGERVERDPRRRSRLDAGLLEPGWHRAGGVVLVGHAEGEGSVLGPVGGLEVLHLAVGSSLVGMSAEVRRANVTTSVALTRLPATRLAHGRDPQRRAQGSAACAEAFVAGLANH